MSTHREDPWAHDPEVCPSPDCPGCWADAYVPRDRWGEDTGRAVLDAAYGNGDRAEDTESGIANDSGSAFYTDSGA